MNDGLMPNWMALYKCLHKRGHPNVTYEEDWGKFEENYDNFKNEYFAPEESLEIFELFQNNF
jgi:hypothetical protein